MVLLHIISLYQTVILLLFFPILKYVDISKRRDSGHIRFKGSKVEEEACALAALQHEGGLILKGHLVTLESLPGKNFMFDQIFRFVG
jgi:hypothetical protein